MFTGGVVSHLRVLSLTGLIVTVSFTETSGQQAPQAPKTSIAQKAQLVENYGRLPLSFEVNTGQADKKVKFLSRGSGFGLYLTGEEAVLALHKGGCARLHGQQVEDVSDSS